MLPRSLRSRSRSRGGPDRAPGAWRANATIIIIIILIIIISSSSIVIIIIISSSSRALGARTRPCSKHDNKYYVEYYLLIYY